ncbi:MAG: outer membrane lipoprotein-sorting protein [Thiotrichales bacterium]
MTYKNPVHSRTKGIFCSLILSSGVALAGVPTDLPYPSGTPTADQIIDQVYYVNHFYALKNFSIETSGDEITALINRARGETPTINTLERYLNNDYSDGVTKAIDLAIFRSGKLRGTGMLITDYVDDAKSQSYVIWLPALRKIRRFAQPSLDDAWGGSAFTFEDVTLRKPFMETHELLGTEKFGACLGAMDLPVEQRTKNTRNLPAPACDHKDKDVYKVKSCTKSQNWYYDCRISYIDTTTFADYRTEYFKGNDTTKVIDRDWGSLGLSDKRAMYWKYWYGKDLKTGFETWAVIPESVVRNNSDHPSSLWSEETLTKIKQ